MKNILLTGKPGVGKTTAIKRIVERLDSHNVNGFWSREIREGGKRVGFLLETISGKTGILAHVDFNTARSVGKYGVNVYDIDTIIVPELQKGRKSGSLIIIDEIAKMEIFSNLFVDEVRMCLETRRVIGTIQERKQPFLDEVRSRRDIELLEITLKNRDKIPFQVLEILNT